MRSPSIPPPNSQPVGQERINPTGQITQITSGPTASAAILASTMEGAAKAIDPLISSLAQAPIPAQGNMPLKQTDPLSPKNKAKPHELHQGGNPKGNEHSSSDTL